MTKFITWSSNHLGNCLCFLLVCLSRSFLTISTKHWIDSRPNLFLLKSSSSVNWSRSISCCRNFFSRIWGNGKSAICLFYKRFPPISDLIYLATWIKINTQFIPRLRLIILSGTGSNRGTKCILRLARFNPRLPLTGFLGTRACTVLRNGPIGLEKNLPGGTFRTEKYFEWIIKYFICKICLGKMNGLNIMQWNLDDCYSVFWS